ncbi:MAG: hypothetical protein E7222_04190 [Clostridiales bacterium]|nr:hypothetical protein [Clostridiales bacterium]
MEHVYTIELGLDLYLVDGRTKIIPTQEYLDYRKEELHHELLELIDKAWKRGHTIYHSNIDAIITMQSECLEKAKRYIGYQFLGTHSYLDVFGRKAEEEYRWQRHQQQTESMEQRLENIQQQMWDMQKLLVNLSKQQNSNLSRRTG